MLPPQIPAGALPQTPAGALPQCPDPRESDTDVCWRPLPPEPEPWSTCLSSRKQQMLRTATWRACRARPRGAPRVACDAHMAGLEHVSCLMPLAGHSVRLPSSCRSPPVAGPR